jgi:hypothetical protein
MNTRLECALMTLSSIFFLSMNVSAQTGASKTSVAPAEKSIGALIHSSDLVDPRPVKPVYTNSTDSLTHSTLKSGQLMTLKDYEKLLQDKKLSSSSPK